MTDNKAYTYEYPRPMMAVDAVVFGVTGTSLEVLLVERKHDPFAGHWALPGGFLEMAEDLDAAAARELAEETGLTGVPVRQFRTFGAPDRDPRGRAISVAFLAVVEAARHTPVAADDAAKAAWWPLTELPPLAFDHDSVLEYAVRALRQWAGIEPWAPWPFSEVPEGTVKRVLGAIDPGQGGLA
ncbi:MAG: NUDIX hydrolase [bacterium]|nr:NUDIX hydrolase [bacterium]